MCPLADRNRQATRSMLLLTLPVVPLVSLLAAIYHAGFSSLLQIGLAQLVGAKALLLYPDPAEFHPTLAQNTVVSSPWWLPNDGTPSLSALANILGDPQTPGYPATSA